MTLINVTPERLEEVSRQLHTGAGEIQNQLYTLQNTVQALGQEWAGVAQVQYLEMWRNWHEAQMKLHQALEGISTLTANAARSFRETDQGVGRTFHV